MPNVNTTKSLTLAEKEQLDAFIQKEYARLLTYALHQTKDEEKAQDLLQDVIVRLYEGHNRIDFTQSPLAYFQFVLRKQRNNRAKKRQFQLEDGIQVGKDGLQTLLREPVEALEGLPYEGFDIEDIDHPKRMVIYRNLLGTFRPKRRWLLDQIEAGVTVVELYPLYCVKYEYTHSFQYFQTEVARLINLVQKKIEARLQDAG